MKKKIFITTLLLPIFLHLYLFYSPTSTRANAADWAFEEKVIDSNPFTTHRNTDIQIGQIDSDQHPDLLFIGRDTSNGGRKSAWYKNPGSRNGTWSRHTFTQGGFKYAALGDLDGDGDLDIAAGKNDDDRVYWFTNDGTPGNDTNWSEHYLGINGLPDIFYIEDLNNDGQNEIIVGYKDGPISILRRPADPTKSWLKTEITNVSTDTAGGSVGDVNNDGKLDIVYGNAWYQNPGSNWTNSSAWNKKTIDSNWPKEARSAVADIDNDGKNDIVLTDEESKSNTKGIAWYRLEGSTWKKNVVNSSYLGVHTCQVGDFNNDGKLDIFAAEMHTRGQKRIAIFEQGSSPTQWTEHIISKIGTHNAKIADIDGDGMIDFAGKNYKETDSIPRVWFSDIEGGGGPDKLSLDKWKRHIIETNLPYNSVFVDGANIDGDNKPDIIAGGWWWKNPGSLSGNWGTKKTIGTKLNNMAIVYDFDQDGDSDILGTTGNEQRSSHDFYWAKNNGFGVFEEKNINDPSGGDFLQGAKVGQIKSGGNVEVVISWHRQEDTGTSWFQVPSDPNNSNWNWQKISSTTYEEQIALADIDGDGDKDIHLGNSWLQNNGGSFTKQGGLTFGNSTAEVDRVEMADIDGDGDADVIVGCEKANRLVWGENKNNGGSWTEQVIATDLLYMSMDIADIDGDGDIDVVAGEHKGSGRVNIFENINGGSSWKKHVVDTGDSSQIDHHDGTQLVDMDNDGDLDIISIGWTQTSLVIYENEAQTGQTPSKYPSPTNRPTSPPSCTCQSDGDANCDGVTNIIDFSIWRGNALAWEAGEPKDIWPADFNCDQKVNIVDFSLWRAGIYSNPATP